MRWQDSLYSGFQKAAERRALTGETNRLEMITARSQSLEVRNQLQQVSADLAIYSLKLQTLMNTETDFYPADTVLRRADFLPVTDSAFLLANPSIGLVRQQVEISHLEKKVEHSRMMPDLNIGFFSQTMQGIQDVEGITQTFGPTDRFTGIQAGIAIPLWFVPYASRSRAAKLKEQIARTNAETCLKSVTGNYHSLLGEFNKYNSSVDYYEKQAVPEADLIIGQATLSYKAGAMDYMDYILNLGRALSIRHNYLDALNNYNQTIVSIEYITGKIF
jgi:cobalt-zinc-cadmium resistance protein CzcA